VFFRGLTSPSLGGSIDGSAVISRGRSLGAPSGKESAGVGGSGGREKHEGTGGNIYHDVKISAPDIKKDGNEPYMGKTSFFILSSQFIREEGGKKHIKDDQDR